MTLLPGEDGQQGVIFGLINIGTFLEKHFIQKGHHRVSLVDVSEKTESFTPPKFLHQVCAHDPRLIICTHFLM